jgi:integrase
VPMRKPTSTRRSKEVSRGVSPMAKVKMLRGAARSEATARSYAQAVGHFVSHGGCIPAKPKKVAEYLASFAGKLAVATLKHRLIAIHRAHVDAGFKSPIGDEHVRQVMQGIRRTYGTGQRRVKALVKDDLLEVLVMVDRQQPMKAARDRALLLVGFAGAFRRSELVALRLEDVTWLPAGMELLIRRSKTDQEGQGRTVFVPYAKGDRCPVKALQEWLRLYGITQGALFTAINRHDRPLGLPLTAQSVALIVKASVVRVRGADARRDVAGHSLRAGFATSAAEAGLQTYQIREVTGHTNDATLAKYVRGVQKRKIPSLL